MQCREAADLNCSNVASHCNSIMKSIIFKSTCTCFLCINPVWCCMFGYFVQSVRHLTMVKIKLIHTPPVVDVNVVRPDLKFPLGFSVLDGTVSALCLNIWLCADRTAAGKFFSHSPLSYIHTLIITHTETAYIYSDSCSKWFHYLQYFQQLANTSGARKCRMTTSGASTPHTDFCTITQLHHVQPSCYVQRKRAFCRASYPYQGIHILKEHFLSILKLTRREMIHILLLKVTSYPS